MLADGFARANDDDVKMDSSGLLSGAAVLQRTNSTGEGLQEGLRLTCKLP